VVKQPILIALALAGQWLTEAADFVRQSLTRVNTFKADGSTGRLLATSIAL
jgi:hypothetical protein